jgi:hypothetical protein
MNLSAHLTYRIGLEKNKTLFNLNVNEFGEPGKYFSTYVCECLYTNIYIINSLFVCAYFCIYIPESAYAYIYLFVLYIYMHNML